MDNLLTDARALSLDASDYYSPEKQLELIAAAVKPMVASAAKILHEEIIPGTPLPDVERTMLPISV